MSIAEREKLPPACEAVREALPLHVSGDWVGGAPESLGLDPDEEAQDAGAADVSAGTDPDWIEAHLETCAECAAELAGYERAVGSLRAASEEDCPIDLWPAVASAIGELPGSSDAAISVGDLVPLEASTGAHASVDAADGGEADEHSHDGSWRPQRRSLGSLAIAASFLVILGFGIHHRFQRQGEFVGGELPFEASTLGTRSAGETARGLATDLDPFTVGMMTPVDVYGSSRLLIGASGESGSGDGALFLQREYVPVAAFSKLSF